MGKAPTIIATAFLLAFVGFVLVRTLVGGGGGAAATPVVFDETRSLEEAMAESESSGKPIVALVTADWCPPCQALKRETLTDPAVAEWIGRETVTVYLEDGKHREMISKLPVQAFPTTLMIRDGRVTARIQGFATPTDYLRFLKDAAAAPAEG